MVKLLLFVLAGIHGIESVKKWVEKKQQHHFLHRKHIA
jgi:hypothetical protein